MAGGGDFGSGKMTKEARKGDLGYGVNDRANGKDLQQHRWGCRTEAGPNRS